jgi:hypothetical protein
MRLSCSVPWQQIAVTVALAVVIATNIAITAFITDAVLSFASWSHS